MCRSAGAITRNVVSSTGSNCSTSNSSNASLDDFRRRTASGTPTPTPANASTTITISMITSATIISRIIIMRGNTTKQQTQIKMINTHNRRAQGIAMPNPSGSPRELAAEEEETLADGLATQDKPSADTVAVVPHSTQDPLAAEVVMKAALAGHASQETSLTTVPTQNRQL